MKKVLLHTIKSEGVGGTRTVINDIKNSYLKTKYIFSDLEQEETCGGSLVKAFLFIRKYKRIISSSNADVIYICGLLYSGFLMTLASKLSSVNRIIVSVHGSELDKPRQNPIKRWLFGHIIEPLTVRWADDVFTVCENEMSNPVIRRGDVYERRPLQSGRPGAVRRLRGYDERCRAALADGAAVGRHRGGDGRQAPVLQPLGC